MINLMAKKQKLIELLDQKILLINNLLAANKKITCLDALETEESISRFSIKSLNDLYRSTTDQVVAPLTTKSDLKKSCCNILDELDGLDSSIYNSVIELMIEKINVTVAE